MQRKFSIVLLSMVLVTFSGVAQPTLEWGTFFGGAADDRRPNIAVDPNGNIFMAFETQNYFVGTNTPAFTTAGAYLETFHAINEFGTGIAKFDSTGVLLWATYYGNSSAGMNGKSIPNISADPYGNLYILADTTLGKFNSEGELVWMKPYSSYGRPSPNQNRDYIHCDPLGNVYQTGLASVATYATSNEATPGTHQDTVAGGLFDVYLIKYDSSGNRIWGTYFGGEGEERNFYGGNLIASDNQGNVYLTGQTKSETGIASTGAFRTVLAGESDVFIAKFDSLGGLLWSTYYGGAENDLGANIITDQTGDIYLLGTTYSDTGIATTAALKDTLSGPSDLFLVKFDSDGQRLWGTYLGGEGSEAIQNCGESIALDAFNNVLIYGFTNSPEGIATPGALQSSILSGAYTVFINKFDGNGNRLWGSYFGGSGGGVIGGWGNFSGPNAGGGIQADVWGNIYITNSAGNEAEVTTPNGLFPDPIGSPWSGKDIFLTKFSDCGITAPVAIIGDTLVCEGGELQLYVPTVAGATAYAWIVPQGWSGNSSTDTLTFTPDNNSGAIGVVALAPCGSSDTLFQSITVLPPPQPSIDLNDDILTTGSFATYQWYKDGQALSGATEATLIVQENGSYTVAVTDTNGCTAVADTFEVTTLNISRNTVEKRISVSPNPTTDLLTIHAPFPVQLYLSDLHGRRILEEKEQNVLHLSSFVPGIYFLSITDADGNILKTQKVVKQ